MTVLRHLGRIQEARLALLRASRGRPPCFCVFLALSRLHASGLAQKCAIGQRRMDVCVFTPVCRGAGTVEPGGQHAARVCVAVSVAPLFMRAVSCPLLTNCGAWLSLVRYDPYYSSAVTSTPI